MPDDPTAQHPYPERDHSDHPGGLGSRPASTGAADRAPGTHAERTRALQPIAQMAVTAAATQGGNHP